MAHQGLLETPVLGNLKGRNVLTLDEWATLGATTAFYSFGTFETSTINKRMLRSAVYFS